MSIDDRIDDTAQHFSTRDSKTELKMTAIGARILVVIFGLSGISLAVASGEQLDQEPTIRTLAAVLVVLAGQMVIGVGALRGHLTILRAIEQARAEQRDLLHGVAQAARDEIGPRRDHN